MSYVISNISLKIIYLLVICSISMVESYKLPSYKFHNFDSKYFSQILNELNTSINSLNLRLWGNLEVQNQNHLRTKLNIENNLKHTKDYFALLFTNSSWVRVHKCMSTIIP